MTALIPLVLRGDCLSQLMLIDDSTIDSIVTDPPYGLSATDPAHVVETLTRWAAGERDYTPEGRGFMGKSWDAFVPPPAVWDECMRILKPGGHLLAFAGSRTFDLMALSIRFAGFDIRDSIAWLYGSGFPKSMDVSKAIDKAKGAEREVIGSRTKAGMGGSQTFAQDAWTQANCGTIELDITAPATEAAREWEGWGTALKPAFEPIVVARKPFAGTVAANVLAHGVGALNIDATRIAGDSTMRSNRAEMGYHGGNLASEYTTGSDQGRWPANVMLDESQAAVLDEQSGVSKSRVGDRGAGKGKTATYGEYGTSDAPRGHEDRGGASRFFYVAKAPKSERPVVDGLAHPTVKPLALMRYLIRLVTPPGGLVVDPFAGSGTTLEAAMLEKMQSIGVELTPEYWPLIEARIKRATT